MSARACSYSASPAIALALAVTLSLVITARDAIAQPTAHHPGAWTTADKWPGRTTWPNSVWAVHMGLVEGDTLFARPHSQVLAWGSWYPNRDDGGLWAWNPTYDNATQAGANLTPLPVEFPPLNPFCGTMGSLPNGDGLIVSGTERNIVGEKESARFVHQTRTWVGAPMNDRRWYGNITQLPTATGKLLATAGNRYDHMILFGGRREGPGGGTVVNDVQRYALKDLGEWDPALVDDNTSPWPDEREHHTLADQRNGPYFLFGGKGASGELLGDVWQLALSVDHLQSYTWNQLIIGGDPPVLPAPRWRHAAVVDQEPQVQNQPHSSMYVYGGEDEAGAPVGDLWKLFWNAVQSRWEWSVITNATGTSPGARSGHTAIWDEPNRRMVLFGGKGASGAPMDDNVYVLSIPETGAPAWSIGQPANSTDPRPSPRTLHAMGANILKSKLSMPPVGGWFHGVVFGGLKADGNLSNELWDLFVHPSTTPPTIKWVNRTPVSGPAPAARKRASVIVNDDFPVSVVVFGGEKADGSWDRHPW